MIIRIPLTEKNRTISPIPLDDTSGNGSGNVSTDSTITNTANPLAGFSLPEASFQMTPTTITAYESSRYSHPVAEVNINVPDADLPLIQTWFGNTATETMAPSDTLTKRMTDAVINKISGYLTDTARTSLFTSPFRIGYALRLADGTHACHSSPRLLTPNATAPLMLVRESNLTGNMLQTLTEIINTPITLGVSLPAFTLPEGAAANVTHLDIYATRQTALLTGDETVTGIRTYAYYGENLPSWNYPRLVGDLIKEAALADNSFRIIGSMPIADAIDGLGGLRLPLDTKNLDNWEDFPALDNGGKPVDPDNPGTPIDPEIPHTHIRLTTSPLDLGLPEPTKKIRALTVRGTFTRTPGIEVSLSGSHHRERWHHIASSRGPHIRYLRTIRYRWLRVEIIAPRDSTFDALTFELP